MLFQLTMFPSGGNRGESVSADVAGVIDLIDKSGLPYKVGPMSTTIEGEWDEVIDLINSARKQLRNSHDRLYISITVDDRKDATNRLTGKVASIESALGRKVNQ